MPFSSSLSMTNTFQPDPRSFAAAMALAMLCLGCAPSASSACIDLRLVLAIDSSGSIDASEYALQIDGYARALRDPRVLRAIDAAGKVEIGVILWADNDAPLVILPPRRVDTGPGLDGLVLWIWSPPGGSHPAARGSAARSTRQRRWPIRAPARSEG